MPGVKNCAMELAQWELKYHAELPDCHVLLTRTLIIWGLNQTQFISDLKLSKLFEPLDEESINKIPLSMLDLLSTFYGIIFCDIQDKFKTFFTPSELDPNLTRIICSIFAWFPLNVHNSSKYANIFSHKKNKNHLGEKIFFDLILILQRYQFRLNEAESPDCFVTPLLFALRVEENLEQRSLGAYFTNRDISDFITQKAVIGYLLVQIHKLHLIDKVLPIIINNIEQHPENYIYSSYFQGFLNPYPPLIKKGLTNISDRDLWNTITPQEWGSPGEIWRETIARHQKIQEWLNSLHSFPNPIEVLISGNIDLTKIIKELLSLMDSGWDLLIIAQLVKNLRILDPTCGPGEFLLSSGQLLCDIYHTIFECLKWKDPGLIPKFIGEYYFYYNSFVSRESARDAAISALILENTLYGIDLHPQAVANAKLRLFLFLCSQFDKIQSNSDDNKWKFLQGINLIHFDLHICLGNTLLGCIARQCLPSHVWQFGMADDSLKEEIIAELNATVLPDMNDVSKFHPFHWSVEFYPEIQTKGFDIVLGNPPYLEAKEVDYPLGMQDIAMRNQIFKKPIHALCIERAKQLLHPEGSLAMIVPMALISTQRMQYLQRLIEDRQSIWYSNFAWRPGKLFESVNRALTIFWTLPSNNPHVYSTGYLRWYSNNGVDMRPFLFQQIPYCLVPQDRSYFFVPKFASPLDATIFEQMITLWNESRIINILDKSTNNKQAKANINGSLAERVIFYRSTGGLYWKIFTATLPKFEQSDGSVQSSRTQTIFVNEITNRDAILAVLNSDLFWWWYSISSNLRDLNPWDIENFPIPSNIIQDLRLITLGQELMKDIEKNSEIRTRHQSFTNKGENRTQHFIMKKSKSILNQIDARLADLYGFSPEILDYLQNYDIKYRMDLLRRDN